MSKPSDLLQGTLDLLILKILALESMNGYHLVQRIRQMSSEVLQVSQGSLYPALHKLEVEKWIASEWRTTESNRRAKYYFLTARGRRALRDESANWERLSGAVSAILRTEAV